MSLFFDMKELTSFAQNKSSSAGIDSYDDTCNERLDLRSDWLSKMFRRHFLEHKMSDPEAKLYNSRILDRLKRWCGAHGCAALASGGPAREPGRWRSDVQNIIPTHLLVIHYNSIHFLGMKLP